MPRFQAAAVCIAAVSVTWVSSFFSLLGGLVRLILQHPFVLCGGCTAWGAGGAVGPSPGQRGESPLSPTWEKEWEAHLAALGLEPSLGKGSL